MLALHRGFASFIHGSARYICDLGHPYMVPPRVIHQRREADRDREPDRAGAGHERGGGRAAAGDARAEAHDQRHHARLRHAEAAGQERQRAGHSDRRVDEHRRAQP